MGLSNVEFVHLDLNSCDVDAVSLGLEAKFDVVFAFDAIHDLASPDRHVDPVYNPDLAPSARRLPGCALQTDARCFGPCGS